FQRRKWLGDDGLIVMEKAASQRQSHREDRQHGDRTHYKTPATQNYTHLRSTSPASIGGEIATTNEWPTLTSRVLWPCHRPRAVRGRESLLERYRQFRRFEARIRPGQEHRVPCGKSHGMLSP